MKVKLCVNTLHFSFSAVPNGKSLNLRIGVIELHVTLQRPTVFSASPSMDRSKIKLQLWQLFKLFVTLQNNVKCKRNSTLNNFSSFVITFCFCKMSNTRIIIMSTACYIMTIRVANIMRSIFFCCQLTNFSIVSLKHFCWQLNLKTNGGQLAPRNFS